MSSKTAHRDLNPKGSNRAAAAKEQVRRARRHRRIRLLAVVGTLLLIVIGGIVVQGARSTSGGPSWVPDGALNDGFGLPLGRADAQVTVELYEDFLCPACGQFEQAAGEELRDLAAEGNVRVVYRPIAFLDGYSTTRYSTRALNAAGCAQEADRFPEMHDQLFRNLPPEGGPGLSDARLVELGSRAGVTGDGFADCVRDLSFQRWTEGATDAASKAGVNRTPTVHVNGAELAEPTLAALRDAITAAS